MFCPDIWLPGSFANVCWINLKVFSLLIILFTNAMFRYLASWLICNRFLNKLRSFVCSLYFYRSCRNIHWSVWYCWFWSFVMQWTCYLSTCIWCLHYVLSLQLSQIQNVIKSFLALRKSARAISWLLISFSSLIGRTEFWMISLIDKYVSYRRVGNHGCVIEELN